MRRARRCRGNRGQGDAVVSDLERAGIAGIGLVIIRGLVALRIVGNREFAVILIVLHTISSRFMLPDMRGAGARPSYVENTKTARNRNGSGLNFTVYSRACIIRLTIAPANRLT